MSNWGLGYSSSRRIDIYEITPDDITLHTSYTISERRVDEVAITNCTRCKNIVNRGHK